MLTDRCAGQVVFQDDLQVCLLFPLTPPSTANCLAAGSAKGSKTPGLLQRPPTTPRCAKDLPPRTPTAPKTAPQTAPRTAPRTAGRRDLTSSDGQDNVKVRATALMLSSKDAAAELRPKCASMFTVTLIATAVSASCLCNCGARVTDGTHAVQILVRVRPFSRSETDSGANQAVSVRSPQHLSLLPHTEHAQFIFDCIFDGRTSQDALFEGAPCCLALSYGGSQSEACSLRFAMHSATLHDTDPGTHTR